MCESEADIERTVPEDGIFTRIDRVFHPPAKRLIGSLAVAPFGTPLQIGYYRNRAFGQRLRELAPMHDALFAHLIRTASYITDYQIPKIVEMTDAISLSYARTVKHASMLQARLYAMEATRLAIYEREIVRKCDLSILVSAVDRDFLFPDGQIKAMVCSNGVDTEAFPFRFCPDGRTVIFIGKNIAHYNVDGIRYFVQQIYPIVRSRRPEAQFKVIGQIRKKFAEELRRQGVVVTGPVDSVVDAARSASVAVCPLRIGAGVQNKLLEYMALGVPAITSEVGLEGLHAVPDLHLLTASTPSDWANKVCGLLEDKDRAATIAMEARRFVEAEHSWPQLISQVGNAIEELLSREPRT